MKFNKKWNKLLALGLSTCLLSSCSSNQDSGQTGDTQGATNTSSSSNNASTIATSTQKPKIVATNFAEYDWLRVLLGNQASNFDLILLTDTGVDMHSYNPSVDDIIDITESDLFIYTTGDSSGWVDSIVSGSTNKNQVVMDLAVELGNAVLAYEESEGMEPHNHDECEDEDCDHDHDHDHDECEDEDCDHDDHDHDDHGHDDHDHDDHDHDDHDHDDHDHDDHDHDDHDHDECEDEDCDHDHDHDHDECEDEDCDHDHGHDHDECEDEDCDHDHDHEDGEHVHDEFCDHDHEIDEHVWLSLKNAKTICISLAEQLCALDPDNASEYNENLAEYVAQLDALDAEYSEVVANGNRSYMVVADRFPFLYLTNDYKINYYAAFSGCSAETEASFETIIFLANKVDELGLDVVVTTETGNKVADTVINSTASKNQEIIVLNSMQSISTKDNYLTIMEENLVALEKILN